MANDYFDSFTRLAKGTKARADAVNALFDGVVTGLDKLPSQNQNNRGTRNYAVDTGVADAYACSLSHVTAYEDGQEVVLLIANDSTGPCTLNVSLVGDTAIKMNDGSDPPAGALQADHIAIFRYNGTGTYWQLMGNFSISNSVTSFIATLLDDADASTALTTLGVSAFVKTLLDDANAATARATLEISAANTPVSDSGSYYDGDNAEAVLQEVALKHEPARLFYAHESSPAAMTVTVDPGLLTYGGSLITQAVPQVTGTITAPVTYPRTDRVVIDETDGSILVVTGVEDPAVILPDIPAGYLPCCNVYLLTSSTEITDSMINRERVLHNNQVIVASGSWTPTFDGSSGGSGETYGSQVGTYIRIGDMVTCMFYLNVTSTGTLSGAAQITGLPVTKAASNEGGGIITSGSGLTLPAARNLILTPDSGAMTIQYFNSTTGDTAIGVTEMSTAFTISGTFSYKAA